MGPFSGTRLPSQALLLSSLAFALLGNLHMVCVSATASVYAEYAKDTLMDDPAMCLSSSHACDEARACKSFIYVASCLKSTIPPIYGVRDNGRDEYNYHKKIQCCFKCCMEFTSRHYALLNTQYIMNFTTAEPTYNDYVSVGSEVLEQDEIASAKRNPLQLMKYTQTNSHSILAATPRVSSPVLSISGLAKLSKQLGTKGTIHGKGGLSKISTILTSVREQWELMKGRRMITIAANGECVPREVYANILKRPSDFKNVGVVQLFSQQLPCNYGWIIKDRKKIEINGIILNLMFIQSRLQLIPIGIRDSVLFETALRKLSAVPSRAGSDVTVEADQSVMPRHNRTLDCTCAAQYKEGRELIKELYKLNTPSQQHVQCYVKGKPLRSDGAIKLAPGYSERKEKMYDTVITSDGSVKISFANFKGNEAELVSYYEDLANYKYALSPSSIHFLSPCEWEAMAMGAVPVMKYPLDINLNRAGGVSNNSAWDVFKPSVAKLYENTPIHKIASWGKEFISDSALNNMYPILTAEFSKPPYSIEKAYLYHWVDAFKQLLLTAKPSSRFFTRQHTEMRHFRAPTGQQCGTKATLGKRLPMRSTTANEDLNKARFKTSPQTGKRLLTQLNETVANEFDALLAHEQTRNNSIDLSINMWASRNLGIDNLSSPQRYPLIELVIPRCCEDGFEFQWLFDLVSNFDSRIAIAIYYKCPHCLPTSLAAQWIDEIISTNPRLLARVKRGYYLLDDDLFAKPPLGRLIRQDHAFDSVYNGKEVTAYLKHIITRFDSLADQTLFLHSLPHAHIDFEVFYKVLLYKLNCPNPVPFIHLNVKFKSGPWGACCGFNSTCQTSTWKYIFQGKSMFGNQIDESKVQGKLVAATYSSAQFAVSRDAIRRRDLPFYHRMQAAINGSHDLIGCDDGTREGEWGGHRLTGQYERMWHVIFGHEPKQMKRNSDVTLPSYLRSFADTDRSDGAV